MESPDFEHLHCWHLNLSAVVLDAAPPMYGYQCCHCGKCKHMNDETIKATELNPDPHGPFIPERPGYLHG